MQVPAPRGTWTCDRMTLHLRWHVSRAAPGTRSGINLLLFDPTSLPSEAPEGDRTVGQLPRTAGPIADSHFDVAPVADADAAGDGLAADPAPVGTGRAVWPQSGFTVFERIGRCCDHLLSSEIAWDGIAETPYLLWNYHVSVFVVAEAERAVDQAAVAAERAYVALPA